MDRYIGKLLDGRYEILEVIGRGGMAVVYKAKCHLLNRYVAVKILRDDMAADSDFHLHFKKEAQAVAALSHTNIVSVYDVSRTPEVDYIVMELIEGITMKQYFKSKGALNCKESVHFSAQIARALSHAHSKGIIHRDIKPQNIMISLDGTVKVADFGIAYLESALGENKDNAVGSVHYISPEQAKGYPADARSDIYSLGVMMYEMTTGQLPFVGETAEEIALRHVSAAPAAPRLVNPDIPEELERIILKAMALDIEQRYQTADALLADLDEFRLSNTDTLPGLPRDPDGGKGSENITIPPNVEPVSRSGELTKESYARRHRRAKKVSLLLGILIVLAFAIAVFVFLWNYWLKDLFSEPVKINIPNFIGSDYEKIVYDEEYTKIYNFKVDFKVSPDVRSGLIFEQSPEAGKNRALEGGGIDVSLTVSAGVQLIEVPDVLNKDYREATLELQKAGFVVGEPDYFTSATVTMDFVISTSPEPGDKMPAGSTIYMGVSSGPNIVNLSMPNLVGLYRDSAVAKIESSKLTLGTITNVESNLPVGTVIWQRPEAYTTVEEHTKVYLQVSSGPKETEPPEETEAPEVTENPPETAPDPMAPVAPNVNNAGVGG